jgi:hypothetical protein
MGSGEMKLRIVALLLILAAMVLGASGQNAMAENAGSQGARYASLTGANSAMEAEAMSQATLPVWLDNLLSKLPSEYSTITGKGINQDFVDGPKESGAITSSGFSKPRDIPPLYNSPKIEGEGVWTSEGAPLSETGEPLIYKTVYRPSVDYPTSVVYMAVFNMSRLKTRLFIGHGEPGIYEIAQAPEDTDLSKIVAITNAMWMQRHARGAGAIFRGREVYPMVDGMATLVIYKDNSVDIVEWSNDLPRRLVRDARQLRYLIVKDGLVVNNVVKGHKIKEAEIGLGGFLVDDKGRSTMAKRDLWFLADRSAFGIREDGNLVFAMAHHCGTRDLAKALALAGCKRAMHGDANIHNIVCNFYFRNEKDKIVKRDRLSPEQKKYTMRRYDQGYAKDFFAFYEIPPAKYTATTKD